MKPQHLLFLLCAATVLGAYAAAPATEPPIVALRFVLATDAFKAIQQKLGAKSEEAVTWVDEKRNTVALDSAHSQAVVVRAFLTSLDHQPPEAATTVDFGSIGVALIDRRSPDEPLWIGNVIPGSPAERAGIKPESFLISINGTNAVSMSLTQSTSMVRGPLGTSVTLEVADASLNHTNKFTVKRGKMVISKNKAEFVEE